MGENDDAIGAREFGRLEAEVGALKSEFARRLDSIDSDMGALDDKVSMVLQKLSAEDGAKKARWGLISGVTAVAGAVSGGVAWLVQHLSHGPKP